MTEEEERAADAEITAEEHADGNHEFCELTCEEEFPEEMLRNVILYSALPGSKNALDELLRRERVAAWRKAADQCDQWADAVASLPISASTHYRAAANGLRKMEES